MPNVPVSARAAPLVGLTLIMLSGAATAQSTSPPWIEPDSLCGFAHVVDHPNPTRLITEFVRRAANGEFDRTSDWLAGASLCYGKEPAYDGGAVVDRYGLQRLDSVPGLVRFILNRWVRGVSYPGAREWDQKGLLAHDTLRVRLTPYGWRITNPAWDWMTTQAAKRAGYPVDSASARRR